MDTGIWNSAGTCKPACAFWVQLFLVYGHQRFYSLRYRQKLLYTAEWTYVGMAKCLFIAGALEKTECASHFACAGPCLFYMAHDKRKCVHCQLRLYNHCGNYCIVY